MNAIIICTIIAFGLAFGSFLNVAIYRIPLGLSVIKKASFCPKCQTKIKWYCNIPLVSYIFLKGKCLNCKEKISFRYPLVEMLVAVLLLISYLHFGLTISFYFSIIFILALVLATFIDIDHTYIPDRVHILIILNALGFIGVSLFLDAEYDYLNHLWGLLFSFLTFYAIRFMSSFIYKKESFGFGDCKFFGAIGLYLGLKLALFTFCLMFIATAVVIVFLLAIKKIKKDDAIPFGPFIAISAYIAMLYGDMIVNWYISLT